MKIILLQDEKKLGKKGDIIEASEGYARNYIIPKKIGVEATPKNLNDLKLKKANEERIAQEHLDAAKELAAALEEKIVTVKIKTGEGGKVFGSVSSKEIAAAIKSQHNVEIDKKKIQLAENLKGCGSYEVPIKLHPQVTGKVIVKVTEE
ncbi:MAG: 50S ribosomal protein L9 [Roseburia sp.]|nr:50S ribosomal protein L9 [Roseburia sp.]MCM1099607.1 50S ribosomal protein L9 [Ruminococcus flavefaciens]